jgi:hypothetical protein
MRGRPDANGDRRPRIAAVAGAAPHFTRVYTSAGRCAIMRSAIVGRVKGSGGHAARLHKSAEPDTRGEFRNEPRNDLSASGLARLGELTPGPAIERVGKKGQPAPVCSPHEDQPTTRDFRSKHRQRIALDLFPVQHNEAQTLPSAGASHRRSRSSAGASAGPGTEVGCGSKIADRRISVRSPTNRRRRRRHCARKCVGQPAPRSSRRRQRSDGH